MLKRSSDACSPVIGEAAGMTGNRHLCCSPAERGMIKSYDGYDLSGPRR